MKKYNKSNISLARALRKNMAPWERNPLQHSISLSGSLADSSSVREGRGGCKVGGGEDKRGKGKAECFSLPQSALLTAPSSEGALRTIYALGFFDGVHLGHQALLKACRTLADRWGCKAGVVTFGNHPDALVQGSAPRLINSLSDRKRLLSQFHMDTVLELPFDEDLRSMSWMDFLGMLCRQHQAKGFVCGADFRFGHKGGGTAALLEEYCRTEGLPCAVVPEQKLGDITVSSTHIRALLEAGEVEDANRFLGHPHILSGTVVPGKQLGRTIGVPTANLTLPEGVLCPRRGVYACLAETEYGRHMAVANIGTRPTVEGSGITAEPWLLDFQGDLYGKHLTLELRHFLRPEEKFGSLEELKAAIAADAAKTRVLLKDTGKKL